MPLKKFVFLVGDFVGLDTGSKEEEYGKFIRVFIK